MRKRTSISNSEQRRQEDLKAIYVRHPPVGDVSAKDVPSLCFSWLDKSVSIDTWLTLMAARARFEEGDPLALIEAFIVSHEDGIFPPLWVLNALGKTFRLYHNKQGSQSFEDVLGLNPGRGKSWFKEAVISELQEHLAIEMLRLKGCFSLSNEGAASMLEAKLIEHPIKNTSRWKDIGSHYTAETFRKKYSTWMKASKIQKDPSNVYHPDNPYSPWSTEQRIEFLRTFPRYSWPPIDTLPTKLQRALKRAR